MAADVAIVDVVLSIHVAAAISCFFSAHLLWCCYRMSRKRLLTRQVTYLAFTDVCAFSWEAVVPLSDSWMSCNLRESVFFYTRGAG